MPAALQLLRRGLFPCAPLFPTLAVDLSLLVFVKKLFLRLPPNVTGWCESLEDFWDGRGYRLGTKVCVPLSRVLNVNLTCRFVARRDCVAGLVIHYVGIRSYRHAVKVLCV